MRSQGAGQKDVLMYLLKCKDYRESLKYLAVKGPCLLSLSLGDLGMRINESTRITPYPDSNPLAASASQSSSYILLGDMMKLIEFPREF